MNLSYIYAQSSSAFEIHLVKNLPQFKDNDYPQRLSMKARNKTLALRNNILKSLTGLNLLINLFDYQKCIYYYFDLTPNYHVL